MNLKLPLNLNLSEKDKKIVPFLGIFLVLILFYFLVYHPTNNKIEQLKISLEEKSNELTLQEKEIQEMRSWQNEEKHRKVLSLATFLEDITILANQEKMTISSFSQGDIPNQEKEKKKTEDKSNNPEVAANAAKVLPILLSIKLEGDYFAVESFLKAWKEQVNSVILTSVEINRLENNPRLQLTLTAKALF